MSANASLILSSWASLTSCVLPTAWWVSEAHLTNLLHAGGDGNGQKTSFICGVVLDVPKAGFCNLVLTLVDRGKCAGF